MGSQFCKIGVTNGRNDQTDSLRGLAKERSCYLIWNKTCFFYDAKYPFFFAGSTFAVPFITRDTVEAETPANCATSRMLIIDIFLLRNFSITKDNNKIFLFLSYRYADEAIRLHSL